MNNIINNNLIEYEDEDEYIIVSKNEILARLTEIKGIINNMISMKYRQTLIQKIQDLSSYIYKEELSNKTQGFISPGLGGFESINSILIKLREIDPDLVVPFVVYKILLSLLVMLHRDDIKYPNWITAFVPDNSNIKSIILSIQAMVEIDSLDIENIVN